VPFVIRFLVTGGAGFIGSHIVERLVSQGETVRVLDNLSTGSIDNIAPHGHRVELVQGDLQDRDIAMSAVKGIEVVFHQAALASVPRSVAQPLDTHDACATGTVCLLDACRRAGVRRVVYAGSSSAYGNAETMPKHESFVPQVLSPYAAAKLAGELYMQAFAATYGIETVRLRYFNVFGPRQDPGSPYSAVIPLFVAALLAGRQPTIFGDGTQSRDFTYIDNVVSANLKAAAATGVSGRVYNVACGSTLSVSDLLRKICTLLDKPYAPHFAPPRTGDILHSWADIEAARRDLGYEMEVDLDEGLRRTVAWYVAHARDNQRAPATSAATA
jgi:UDP-glucose 4-epimerase